MNTEIILLVAGIIGTIAFSVSGALVAIENKLDLFGVVILGVITAVGGGLLRDIVFGFEIAMIAGPTFLYISLGVSLAVFVFMYFFGKISWENSKIYKTFFNIIDSIGLGAFTVVGINTCLHNNVHNALPIFFSALLTAVGGGLMRDIMVRKIPFIFRKHIYAVAALFGTMLYYVLYKINTPDLFNTIITVLVVVIIRYLAFRFEWSLPKVHLKDENGLQ